MANEFNKYSIKNQLNITIEVNYFSRLNSTGYVDDYATMLEILVKQKKPKYDLYFYDNVFSIKYGPYLEDLRKWIPSEHFEIYESGIAPKSCVYGKKWVGLPINIDITFLYYNHNFLNKYNKRVPTTWNELFETGKYILEEEKKLNNTEIVIYNGLFSRAEIGTCSLYEFIYSYRDSVDSSFPELQSEESKNAIEMIKKIKDELSSNEIFQSNEMFTGSKFSSNQFLFQKFWYFPSITAYKFALLPGRKEGISGSVIGGYNLGMSKYINEERRNAAITAFKFLTSKELQKKMVLENNVISAIPSLYEDDDVCSFLDCDIFKNTQLTNRPTNKISDYDEYSKKFREYIYDYLYGNKTSTEVLKSIDDITRIYSISFDSFLGVFVFSLTIFFSLIMLSSLLYLKVEKFSFRLNFLSKSLLILSVIGGCIFLNSLNTEIGEIKKIRCHIELIMLCIGETLNIVPVLCQLMINFPEENKYSRWISNHKFIFVSIFVILSIIESVLMFIKPYNVKKYRISNGELYRICEIDSNFGKVLIFMIILNKSFVYLCLGFLIFVEWSIKETSTDLKFLLSAIAIDILCLLIHVGLKFTNLKNKYYNIYFAVYSALIFIYSFSNYMFLYGLKYFICFIKIDNENEIIIKNMYKQYNNKSNAQNLNTQTSQSTPNTQFGPGTQFSQTSPSEFGVISNDSLSSNKSKGSGLHGISKKIMAYHNQESLTDSNTSMNVKKSTLSNSQIYN
ncbi:periplasmic binding protein-like II [Neocallimastix lanati (nom. inval.)]|uniref:Periplasmic binding protein-like II n=1 Tax=Neocallimastix californiae TaxID=1754190 RepID=A0A1Y2EGN5_9FUNG|nr:periplasmic binding protein-like II [Neocallimastix sp. JGI-2020a]ORY70731.1 periplasmic binding protein-like II [Neocallimastix californiae]|eukprot:ORY70731.1 periplasmic binding protein-like II [Neocallimastix californiae]